MDKRAPGKEGPEEVTRESLIAISYSLPDSKLSLENLPSEKPIDCDGAEKYRSELISISYRQSPETKGIPLTPGEPKS